MVSTHDLLVPCWEDEPVQSILLQLTNQKDPIVGGQNPALVGRWFTPTFMEFYPSQLVRTASVYPYDGRYVSFFFFLGGAQGDEKWNDPCKPSHKWFPLRDPWVHSISHSLPIASASFHHGIPTVSTQLGLPSAERSERSELAELAPGAAGGGAGRFWGGRGSRRKTADLCVNCGNLKDTYKIRWLVLSFFMCVCVCVFFCSSFVLCFFSYFLLFSFSRFLFVWVGRGLQGMSYVGIFTTFPRKQTSESLEYDDSPLIGGPV